MFLFEEKRKMADRRIRDEGPPAGCRERRTTIDRRQTQIAEITLTEWTRHFQIFQEHTVAKKAQHARMARVSAEIQLR